MVVFSEPKFVLRWKTESELDQIKVMEGDVFGTSFWP